MLNESDDDIISRFHMQTPGKLGGGSLANPESSTLSHHPSLPQSSAAELDYRKLMQETEAKCSRLLADAESRILEERNKFKEREMSIKEDQVKEKARASQASQQTVTDLLSAYQNKAEKAALSSIAHGDTRVAHVQQESAAVIRDLEEKVRRLELQLQEKERELAATEKRHQDEKRELLALRTNQLRLEGAKKGKEDLVSKAMQTLAEYEAAIRQSETENAKRLAEYMDSFTKDWLKRTQEFEEYKSRFEAEIMHRAFEVLKEHELDLERREEGAKNRMMEVLKQQSDVRSEQEHRLMEQFEQFKIEYKELQDRDFSTRCNLFDRALEKREQMMMERIEAEREKLLHMEQQYGNASEMQKIASLNEAMAQVSSMREAVLAENQKRQEELHRELLKQRERMHLEITESERRKNEQLALMQQQVYDAMDNAQRIVAGVEDRVAEREAELHAKYMEMLNARNSERDAELGEFKDNLEKQYFQRLDDLKADHSRELKKLTDEFVEKRDRDSAEVFRREQEMRVCYEAKQSHFEDALQSKYQRQLQEAHDNDAALRDTITTLKREIDELQKQNKQIQMQSQTRELQWEGKIAKLQREAEGAKLAAEEELRSRYEKWLQDSLDGVHRAAVDRKEYERMQRDLEAAEQRCHDLLRREREAMAGEREHLKESFEKRLAEERKRLEELEADLLEKAAEMRVELEAETKRKEASAARLVEAERKRLHDEAVERAVEESRERSQFEERIRDEEGARWKTINKELQATCDERVKAAEQRAAEREAQLAKREAELRDERHKLSQLLAAERQKIESEEWEMKTKLEEQLRDEAEERLSAERSRLQAELETIRKHAADQRQAMEEAKAQLQRKMADDRLKAEEAVKERYEAIMERMASDHREAMQQRDAMALERELAVKDAHQQDMTTLKKLHAEEIEKLNRINDEERAKMEMAKAEFEAKCREQIALREQAVKSEAQARIKAEQEALRQKELQLLADNDRIRLEIEAKSRETMQQFLEARGQQWEQLEAERAKAEQSFFDRLRKETLHKEADIAAKQLKMEEEMRHRTEQAIKEFRQKADTAQQQELSSLREEAAQLRMQLQQQRTVNTIDDAARFEARLTELRQAAEQARDEDRKQLQDACDRQLADMQKRCDRKIDDIHKEHEKQLEGMRDRLLAEKDQLQLQLARKDEEAMRQHEALAHELQKRMDSLLNEVRGHYEKKWRQKEEADLERASQLAKQKADYEAKIRSNYEQLLKEAEANHAKGLEEREKQHQTLDRERDRVVQALRQELNAVRLGEAEIVEARAKEKVAEVTRQLEREKQDFANALEQEREKRTQAERNVSTLQAEVEKLNASMNQWKLDLHKSLVQKYEKLFNEVQSRARKDRESFARKLLEEEERRLARELVRKDNELARSREEDSRLAAREAEERDRKVEHFEVQQKLAHLLAAIAAKREKLLQLWQLIDTDPKERLQLLVRVLSHIGQTGGRGVNSPNVSPPRQGRGGGDAEQTMLDVLSAIYDEVCGEIKRLEEQLPLMDTITRREFVKHRLSEVMATPASSMREKQLAELRRELQRLNEQLLQDLPQYEQNHNAKLFYKNQRYLHVMERDMQDMLSSPQGGHPYPTRSPQPLSHPHTPVMTHAP
eukprot:Sspe_Gene.1375::Locus_462_Transcript_1_1_Confidence_1.000_Length_5077::g.1375::m.1375